MIIDTHGHFQEPGYPIGSEAAVGAAEMLDTMDRYDIAQLWLSPIVGCLRDTGVHNRNLYEQVVRPYTERFVGYAVLNPSDPEALEDECKRCFLDYGFGAIKVHNWLQGFGAQQEATYRLVEASIRYGVPIMFHDGTPPYADTHQIAQLAERYPQARIILGHAGLYDSYRGAIETVNTHDNLWMIVIGPTVGDARKILAQTRPDRILFGTDYCCAGAGWQGETILRDRLEILQLACPDIALLRRITVDNAKALIDI